MKYCRHLKHCADINSLNLHHPFQCRQAEGDAVHVQSRCGSQRSAPGTRKQGQTLLRGQERTRGQRTQVARGQRGNSYEVSGEKTHLLQKGWSLTGTSCLAMKSPSLEIRLEKAPSNCNGLLSCI